VIAAVVDPRGEGAALAAIAAMGGDWDETRSRGSVAVACSRKGPRELALGEPATITEAASEKGSGAFVSFARDAEGALVLGRGSLGGRPLYYAPRGAGGWVVCSEVEPLLAALGRPASPDADHLAALVVGVADPTPTATAFREIARLAPCTAVELAAGGTSSVRERPRAELAPLPTPFTDVDALAEELWRRVEASVRRAIGGAKTVAVMVGGGVDSSGLLAAAIAAARGASSAEAREVLALALDFDAQCSDRPYRRDLARALGIEPIALAPREAAPWFASTFVLDAQPYILGIGPMEQLVFRRARERGAEVLLTGYLADEILAGDLRGLAVEARAGSPLRALRNALRLELPWPTTRRERVASYIVRPLLKPLVPRALLRRSGARGHARDYPWARPRLSRKLAALRDWGAGLSPPRTDAERYERFERWPLYADYADWRGQMESATGLVRRDPYADEDVLALLASVPQSVLSHGGWYRGLFRVALRGRVPESIRWRTDKSWFEPAFAETAEAAGGLRSLGDLWRPRALEALDILDAAAFERAMTPLFEEPSSTEKCADLWSLAAQVLACESFARRHEARS